MTVAIVVYKGLIPVVGRILTHIVVDTLGLPMAIKVHEANIHDSEEAIPT